MLNAKYQRYADRLRELIKEGQTIATNIERWEHRFDGAGGAFARGFGDHDGNEIQRKNQIQLQGWLTKTRNILETAFGGRTPHLSDFEAVFRRYGIVQTTSDAKYEIIGILTAASDNLEKGYLVSQEFVIAGEVFESVLEQAKQLVQRGCKDPAAVIAPVILQDALRRLARSEGIDEKLNASAINEELKKKGKYPQAQGRMIQSWLDIGNAAADGKFNEYKDEDVNHLIEGVERFLATEFRE